MERRVMLNKSWVLIAAFVALAGCKADAEEGDKYAVSDEHCTPDYWKTLPDDNARESLVEKCMSRGSYQQSEPKTW